MARAGVRAPCAAPGAASARAGEPSQVGVAIRVARSAPRPAAATSAFSSSAGAAPSGTTAATVTRRGSRWARATRSRSSGVARRIASR